MEHKAMIFCVGVAFFVLSLGFTDALSIAPPVSCYRACGAQEVLDPVRCVCKPRRYLDRCPPLCKNLCPYGRVIDSNGCPTCRCKKLIQTIRPPISRCGPVCLIYCPNGNVLDSRGCPTCRCKPARPERYY